MHTAHRTRARAHRGACRSFDVDATTARGDEMFGGALLLAATVTVMINALRDDEVGPAS